MDILQVIIDSQPLTVAVLAALLFGESIGVVGAAGLVLGVIGLVLLEVNLNSNQKSVNQLSYPLKHNPKLAVEFLSVKFRRIRFAIVTTIQKIQLPNLLFFLVILKYTISLSLSNDFYVLCII